MPEELMIRHCAPTMACMKTGSLFTCPFESREVMNREMREMNRRLRERGLRVMPLRFRNGTALVYAYRPGQLERDLNQEDAARLLARQGYGCPCEAKCVRRLTERLCAGGEFPHEIGLFLGYPPEDVEGFMNRREDVKLCGAWKVYGDAEAAQRLFDRYKKCTSVYLEKWKEGFSIERLTVKRASN